MNRLSLSFLMVCAAGCNSGSTPAPADAGRHDTGLVDAGTPDAGVGDVGAPDAGLADTGNEDAGDTGTTRVHFQSGFEPDTRVVTTRLTKCSNDLEGAQITPSLSRSDWTSHLEATPLGTTRFCYGGADRCEAANEPNCQRGIELVDDPDDPSNTVLRTWLKEPAENVSDTDNQACSNSEGLDDRMARKARVQMSIAAASPVNELTYSIRIKLSEEAFATLVREYPDRVRWMTLGEYWNNQDNAAPNSQTFGDRSRVTLNVVNNGPNTPFRFGLKADWQADGATGWTPTWHEPDGALVPIGSWFTLTVRLTAGDATRGRIVITMTASSGEETVLFDVAKANQYPQGDVVGFTHIQPIKLYTSGNLVCGLKRYNKTLEAWWDDLRVTIP